MLYGKTVVVTVEKGDLSWDPTSAFLLVDSPPRRPSLENRTSTPQDEGQGGPNQPSPERLLPVNFTLNFLFSVDDPPSRPSGPSLTPHLPSPDPLSHHSAFRGTPPKVRTLLGPLVYLHSCPPTPVPSVSLVSAQRLTYDPVSAGDFRPLPL